MDEPLFKTFKGKLIAFIVGLALIAGISYFVLFYQDLKFRSVVVDEVTGTVSVDGGGKSGKLTVGEHLVDGDYVSVPSEAALTLCADTNKYLRADENTSFKIETGNILTGKGIRIVMDSGSTLSTLDEKLKEGEFWQVDTPNSTMAVRGTTFRVTVYKSKLEKTYTLLEVEKGAVQVNTHLADDKTQLEEDLFSVGECAVIKGDDKKSTFLKDKKGNTKWTLDYDALPEDNVERLVEILEDAGERLEPQQQRQEPEQQQEQEPEQQQEQEQQQQQQQETPEHVHQFNVTFESDDCEAGGTETRVCAECGYTETATVSRLHTYNPNETWSENGQRVYSCSVCHKSVLAGEYCANAGHSWESMGDETEDNITKYTWECSVCGGVVNKYNDSST
ncbi:MAG: FecR family protein, partial [Lachnospiraceae bacterium]|nr:FecR family protein [Lachnospiraceae bacterium]